MRRSLLVSAAILATVGAAAAADLPARYPVKAPPVVAPAFNWSGFYVGGFVGGAWSADDTVVTPNFLSPGRFAYGYAYKPDSSFIGGGTIGWNWQPVGSPFVLGLEGEVGYLGLKGSAADPFFPTIVSSSKVGDWYGIIAGRLGYSWDRALIYVKGGVAFVDIENAITYPGFAGSVSETKATWTVGGGLEYAFDLNWSIKAEYLYIGLDQTQTVVDPFRNAWAHDDSGIHTAKVGINYRFGAPAPVVARY